MKTLKLTGNMVAIPIDPQAEPAAPKRIAELESALRGMMELCLDMGAVIRASEQADEAIEYWTQDGSYIPDTRFYAAKKALPVDHIDAGEEATRPPYDC